MSRTREEISQLLATKFQAESARLNSWGTKTDDKAAISFAMRVVDFVRALMAESRSREAKHILRKFEKIGPGGLHGENRRFVAYIQERITATKTMAKAIEKFGEKKESERPFGHKKKHKHHHGHHHESKRSSRSSRH